MAFIYKTTNLINGKIYIGKNNGKRNGYLGSGLLITAAIKKYGKENFKREIIEDNIEDIDILNEKEKYWIKFFDSRNRDIGYNISLGGDGANMDNKGKTYEEMYGEEKAKILKENISKNYSGENHPMYGKIHSDESKLKMSESAKGRVASEETRERQSKARKGKKIKRKDPKKIAKNRQGIRNHGEKNKYVGVIYREDKNRYIAEITFEKKRIYIGTFKTEIEAALAYNVRAIELYGVDAKINIIDYDNIKEFEQKQNKNKWSKTNKKTKSIYFGVSQEGKRWRADIQKNKIRYYLGGFDTEKEAALAYNQKSLELYGPNAKINIIQEEDSDNDK